MAIKQFMNCIYIMIIFAVLTGCSKTILVNPELQYVNPPDRITNGSLKSKIDLINNQQSNKAKYFSDFTIHKLEGNMHEWTDQVVQLAKHELEQRGALVTENAVKKMYFSFEGTELELGSFVYICKGTLKVKTSSGYESKYSVSNRTPGTVNRACGGAITLSVIDLLNDKNIQLFLNNTEE